MAATTIIAAAEDEAEVGEAGALAAVAAAAIIRDAGTTARLAAREEAKVLVPACPMR